MPIKHTEKIAEVGATYAEGRPDGRVMIVEVVTGGGVHKKLEFPEDAARWLIASIKDGRERWFADEDE